MKNHQLVILGLLTAIFPGVVSAQSLPQGSVLPGDKLIPSGASQNSGQKAKMLPGDQTIPSYEVGDPELRAAMEKSRKALEDIRNRPMGAQPPVEPAQSALAEPDAQPVAAESQPLPEAVPTPPVRKKIKNRYENRAYSVSQGDGPSYSDTKEGVRIFNQGLIAARSPGKDTFTLPATSIALATTLYGIEATGNVERFVPAELNYAWLGPNGTVVEMKNCRLWISVRGDYSTERIYGRSQSISCRAPTGETFDIPIEAHMVDQKEEYLGARGTLVARGKALASALSFLSDGVKSFGSAMAAAQVNTEVSSGGGFGDPVKGSNVGGDKNKYIIGQTLSGSSAKFLDWWIDYYQSLSPTIAIGPGKKIYLALHRTVHIPKVFFGEKLNSRQIEAISLIEKGEPGDSADSSQKVNTSHALKASHQEVIGEGGGTSKDEGEDKP